MSDCTEDDMCMDRYTFSAVKRAVKGRKLLENLHEYLQEHNKVVYCRRCLKSNYEVEIMLYDSYFNVCSECIDNLSIFLGHVRRNKEESHGKAIKT